MVYFLGVFSPGFGKREPADEAPGKTAFFGAMADAAPIEVPLSRAEQDACYLGGKSWDTDPVGSAAATPADAVLRYTL